MDYERRLSEIEKQCNQITNKRMTEISQEEWTLLGKLQDEYCDLLEKNAFRRGVKC